MKLILIDEPRMIVDIDVIDTIYDGSDHIYYLIRNCPDLKNYDEVIRNCARRIIYRKGMSYFAINIDVVVCDDNETSLLTVTKLPTSEE